MTFNHSFTDSFNRANEDPLDSKGWSPWYGAGLKLVSNHLEPAAAWAGSIRADSISDCEVQVKLLVIPVGGGADLFIRAASDFTGGYCLGVDRATNEITIWRAEQQLGWPVLASAAHIPVAGNSYRLRAEGGQLTASVDTGAGWTQVLSVYDTVYTEGFLGLDASAGVQLDDYAASWYVAVETFSLLNRTCTVINRTTDVVVDDYGNEAAGTSSLATATVPCEIQQVRRAEPGEEGEFSISEWMGFFPSGTTFDTGDQISEASLGTFEVVGRPWDADSGSDAVNHVEATLKEA